MSYINEFIISVKDPKSDNERKIKGTINFIEDNTRLGSNSILKELPNPWTNIITGQIVANNTGEIFYNIVPKLYATTTTLSDETIRGLQNIIEETYGVSINLEYTNPEYVETTSLISNTGNTSSIISSTSSTVPINNNEKLQEFTFNVELQDIFFNQNTGNLYIFGQEDNVLLDNSDIASIYDENAFAGDEEVAMKLEYDKYPQSIDNIDSTDGAYDTPNPEVRPVKIKIDGNSWYAVAANYISKKEGFLSVAKWDVNHYRGGYGTQFKLVGSNLIEVTSTTRFTLQEAITTLQYQLKEDYEPIMISSFGSSNWARLNKNQKAAIVSLAYNCGPYIYTKAGVSSRAYARTVKEGVLTHNANLISKGIASGPIRGGGRVYTALIERRSEEAGLALG